jgi:phage repressor protein C with HTH and peptisase S24 domain
MDLFAPALRPDALQSSAVRISAVNGDNMEPTLRGNWDYVACAPVNSYEGEGLYLLDNGGFGIPQVYRCEATLSGEKAVRVMSDNKLYPDHVFTAAMFESMVLAKVVADIKIRDERRLRRLAG